MSRRPAYLKHWQPTAAQRKVAGATAEAFGVSETTLLSPNAPRGDERRNRGRAALAWLLRERWPELSYPCLAVLLDVSDHTTALHLVRRGAERRLTDMVFHAATDALLRGERVRGPKVLERVPAHVLAAHEARVAALRAQEDPEEQAHRTEKQRMAELSARFVEAIERERMAA